MDKDISLSPHSAEMVRHKVESGEYGSPEEVVEEALFLLENYDELRSIREKSLRAAIKEGMGSGAPIPAEDVFAELIEEFEVTQK